MWKHGSFQAAVNASTLVMYVTTAATGPLLGIGRWRAPSAYKPWSTVRFVGSVQMSFTYSLIDRASALGHAKCPIVCLGRGAQTVGVLTKDIGFLTTSKYELDPCPDKAL